MECVYAEEGLPELHLVLCRGGRHSIRAWNLALHSRVQRGHESLQEVTVGVSNPLSRQPEPARRSRCAEVIHLPEDASLPRPHDTPPFALRHRRRWWLTSLAATAGLAAGISGCASSPQFPAVGGAGKSTPAQASWPNWDQCLRSQGLSVPAGYIPDGHHGPKPEGSTAALKACQRYQPPSQLPPASVRSEVIAASKCMAAHGFSNTYWFFPGGDGIQFAHGISPSTPGFSEAVKACGRFA